VAAALSGVFMLWGARFAPRLGEKAIQGAGG
jgi:hypothetical protein